MSSSTDPVDLSETRQPEIYAISTIFWAFAVLAVVLRFWCRWTKRAGLWLDDWLVVVALMCATGTMCDLLWLTPRAYGKHAGAFGPKVFYYFFLGLFIIELTYVGVIVCVKLSIIALYWRIFNKSSIRVPLYVSTALVLMWGLAVLLITCLQCIPIQGYWDKSIEAHCGVNSKQFLPGQSIPNIILDIGLLVLPIPWILQLKISNLQKRAVIAMFLLGGVVCFATIMRLVTTLTGRTDPDISWDHVDIGIWSVIEADLSIIAACLPVLRPVWLRLRPRGMTTQDSGDSSNPYARSPKASQKRVRSLPSYMSRTDDEEDLQPFSNTNAEMPYMSRTSLKPQTNPKIPAISLSHFGTSASKDGRQNTRKNEWDADYGPRTYPRYEAV